MLVYWQCKIVYNEFQSLPKHIVHSASSRQCTMNPLVKLISILSSTIIPLLSTAPRLGYPFAYS